MQRAEKLVKNDGPRRKPRETKSAGGEAESLKIWLFMCQKKKPDPLLHSIYKNFK